MIPWIAAALLTQSAMADDCDAKSIKAEMADASPVQVPAIYAKLAECDPAAAKKATKDVLSKTLAGEASNGGVLAAINLGEGNQVRTWLDGLEPDDRSRTVSWLGEQCNDQEAVQTFFTDARAEVGETFWKDRWYRGLDACRVEPIQALLSEAVADKSLAKNTSLYFGIIEVYARNLRADAIPTLAALAQQTDDEETLVLLVNAFADAANVGTAEGIDPKAAGQAAEAIKSIGSKLPPRAIEQARTTLTKLGAEEIADSFAVYRWPDALADRTYHYALVLVESATCKNGKTLANIHFATFMNEGNVWPDQLESRLRDKLVFEWGLTAAASCKGEGTLSFTLPAEPFVDSSDRTKWLEEKVDGVDTAPYGKTKRMKHDPFTL